MAHRADVGLIMWPVGRGVRHLVVGPRGVHVVVTRGVDIVVGLRLDLVEHLNTLTYINLFFLYVIN